MQTIWVTDHREVFMEYSTVTKRTLTVLKKKKTRSQELVLLQVIMKVISDRVAEAFAACLL